MPDDAPESEVKEESPMCPIVETMTPPNAPRPIGPYGHIARAGPFIAIGGVAGVDPENGELAGPDVASQTRRILFSLGELLTSAGSDLSRIMHIHVFMKDMRGFDEMNRAYVEVMGDLRPARTVVGVSDLPKEGALLTMNLTAVAAD